MKSFLIVTNKQKDGQGEITSKIQKYLTDANEQNVVQISYVSRLDFLVDKELISKAECVIVLGGDGTLLRVAKQTTDQHIPVIGVNLGHLGYLAEVEVNVIYEALDALMSDSFKVDSHMLLKGKVMRNNVCIYQSEALNDIVITRGGSLQALSLSVYVNRKLLNSYHADGIIVATPTGSTAYNFSAGGPIVEPGTEVMLLTPISPHTFMNRSIVLKSSDCVEVEIKAQEIIGEQSVEVNFDGANRVELLPKDRVELVRSDKTVSIIKLNQVGFVEVLHRKMSES